RIDEFLAGQDLRGGGQVHGAALFADGNERFSAHALWRAAPDLATAERRFVLRPAAALATRANEVLMVEAGRELHVPTRAAEAPETEDITRARAQIRDVIDRTDRARPRSTPRRSATPSTRPAAPSSPSYGPPRQR